MQDGSTVKKRQTLLLTAIAASLWFATAVGSFQSVYLQEKGFTATQLGRINALCSTVNIFAVGFWGLVSDSARSRKRVLAAVMAAGLALSAGIPALPLGKPYSFLLMLLFLACVKFFYGPMITLTENLLVRDSAERGLNYGGVRSAASTFYALGGLAATGIAAKRSTGATFWIGALTGIPAVLLILSDREPGKCREKPESREKMQWSDLKLLIQNKRYALFLLFSFLFYMAMYCRLSFMPYYMKGIGVDTGKYGLVVAYGAILEIPSFLLLKWLHRRFSYRKLVVLSAGLEVLEALLLCTVCRSLAGLLTATTFYGLGNGMFLAASLNYIYELAPKNMKASTQGFCDAAAAIAGVVGNLLGGAAMEWLGAKGFYFGIMVTYLVSIGIFLLPGRGRQRVNA